jgi:type VI secretion system protein VasG
VADIRALLNRLNTESKKHLEGSISSCVTRGHYEVTAAHFLDQALARKDGSITQILLESESDVNLWKVELQKDLQTYKTGNTSRPVFHPQFAKTLEEAWGIASLEWGLAELTPAAFFASLRKAPAALSPALQDLIKTLKTEDFAAKFGHASTSPGPELSEESFLEKFTTDFVAMAQEGKIDPIFGRDDEIRMATDILSRRRKNNPIFLGEAGVGKTAVVEGLALKVAEGDVPPILKDAQIRNLDLGTLSAGAGVRGEFENRLKGLIAEVKESPANIILFIDEAHTLMGAGGDKGTNDAANLLKPEMARGELKIIAATTHSEFRKHMEKDPAIARRFQSVVVPEPSPEQAAQMLRGLREKYEEFHNVQISYAALQSACMLSHKYIAGRQLPDKAVDLLDTAAARVKMANTTKAHKVQDLETEIFHLDLEIKTLEKDQSNSLPVEAEQITELVEKLAATQADLEVMESRFNQEKEMVERLYTLQKENSPELAQAWQDLELFQGEEPLIPVAVTPNVVAGIIEEWTGIPAGNMMRSEANALLELEATLNEQVIGQSWGIAELSNTLKAGRMELGRPEAPVGVFLVTGPSGVGKTEVARTIAEELYGGADRVVTINMSEYQDSMSVTQLKGASAGYVGYGDGGVLTEAVRKKPYTVVILDEVEKAHKDVLNMFYQVFDQGQLRDGEGRMIDFRNTVILMTSNLGLDTITEMVQSEEDFEYHEYSDAILPELTAHFAPALLGRCKIVPFMPLGIDSLQKIATMKLQKLAKRMMQKHKMALALSPKIIYHIIEQCTRVQSGARYIDTLVDKEILPAISNGLLQNVATEQDFTHLFLTINPAHQIHCEFSLEDFILPEWETNPPAEEATTPEVPANPEAETSANAETPAETSTDVENPAETQEA